MEIDDFIENGFFRSSLVFILLLITTMMGNRHAGIAGGRSRSIKKGMCGNCFLVIKQRGIE